MCGFIYMNKCLKNRIFKLVLRPAANEVLYFFPEKLSLAFIKIFFVRMASFICCKT